MLLLFYHCLLEISLKSRGYKTTLFREKGDGKLFREKGEGGEKIREKGDENLGDMGPCRTNSLLIYHQATLSFMLYLSNLQAKMNLNTKKTQIFQFLHSSIVRQKETSKLREPTDDRI